MGCGASTESDAMRSKYHARARTSLATTTDAALAPSTSDGDGDDRASVSAASTATAIIAFDAVDEDEAPAASSAEVDDDAAKSAASAEHLRSVLRDRGIDQLALSTSSFGRSRSTTPTTTNAFSGFPSNSNTNSHQHNPQRSALLDLPRHNPAASTRTDNEYDDGAATGSNVGHNSMLDTMGTSLNAFSLSLQDGGACFTPLGRQYCPVANQQAS